MNIFFDLETTPAVDPTEDEIKAASRKKLPDAIQKDFEENYEVLLQAALKKKGVSMYESKIVCLAYAFNDGEVIAITGKEKNILETFENAIRNFHEKDGGSPEGNVLFAFNGDGFDFPLLFLKACLHNVQTIKSMLFYASKKDVMKMGTFHQYGKFVSLDNLCKFFGMEGKGNIDGSQVYPMYKEGKIEEIAEYCRQDVIKTRKLETILRP